MRFLFLTITLLIASPSAFAQTDEDRVAIEGALANWLAGWDDKNVELAVKDYSADADFTNAFGMTRRGQDDIRALLEQVFSFGFVMAGDTVYPPPEVRFLMSDVALVRTSAERTGQMTAEGESLGVRRTTHLRVFEKRDGRWLIVSHLISDARDTERPAH